MTNATAIHPFEQAGLGKAPFRLIGLIQQDLAYGQVCLNRAEFDKTGVLLTTKPGGSCDFCGTYIVNMFRVKSADGREFKVGCDCAAKVAKEAADTDMARQLAKAEAPLRKARAARAKASKSARISAAVAARAAVSETVHAELLARLDRAAHEHPAFGRMADELRSGRTAALSARQMAWLSKVEP